MLPILYKYSPSYSGASVDTTPFNERYTGRGSALVYTASCLLKCPSMSAVYATDIVPVFPAFIGDLVHVASVQPHEVSTLFITNDLFPALVTVNVAMRSLFQSTVPRSRLVASNLACGWAAAPLAASRNIDMIVCLFIGGNA